MPDQLLFTSSEIRNYISFVALISPLLIIFVSERYKNQIARTQKAERVGELFAFIPTIITGKALDYSETKRFNQLINELSLCLPYELVCELSETLCKVQNIGNYKNLLVKIRLYMYHPWSYRASRILSKFGKGDGLKGDNISHMAQPNPPNPEIV